MSFNLLSLSEKHFDHLKEELEILFDHINRYASKSSVEKCWPIIFRIDDNLGIRNLLHFLETCLVAAISNEELERVFSLLWRIFLKERQSLKHDTRTSFTYTVRQRSEQRKIWRCCWNVFKRIPRWYHLKEKTPSTRSCVPV